MAELTPGERGVSTPAGYSLNVAISVVLVTLLLLAVGAHVADQRERAVETESARVGQHLGSKLQTADRLARTTDDTVTVTAALPDRLAGRSYRIAVENHGSRTLVVVSMDAPRTSVSVEVRTETPVEPTVVSGGDVLIRYDGTNLEVESDG